MRFEGYLKTWNDERGFGFIEPLAGGQEIFVHVKAFPGGVSRPVPNLKLTFEVEMTSDGKKKAKNIQLLRVSKPTSNPAFNLRGKWSKSSVFALCSFGLLFLVVNLVWRPSALFAIGYLMASLVCFLLYTHDKNAAEAGEWRTSEGALLVAGLLGGWPGALMAQQMLRHKTSKVSFQAAFWITVVINVAGLIWMTTPLGQIRS